MRYQDFADKEALLLAQEKTGALLEPPKEVYEKIHKDFTAIRKAYPVLSNVFHQPNYAVSHIACQKFIKEMADKLNASEFVPIKEKRNGTLNYEVSLSRSHTIYPLSSTSWPKKVLPLDVRSKN